MTQIIHSISGKVIDVPDQHAQMLKTQGWVDYVGEPRKETQNETDQSTEAVTDQDAEAEAQRPQAEVLKPVEAAPKRGRPRKVVQIDNEVV